MKKKNVLHTPNEANLNTFAKYAVLFSILIVTAHLL